MQLSNNIQIVECPRDAMQGWPHPIDTATKIKYLNALLKVGFHSLDFGSFVSPKAIPQMADTKAVLAGLQLDKNAKNAGLLAIIANLRGATEALNFPEIRYLGFPFSISETFQQLNTNSSISKSFETVQQIQSLCQQNQKELVIYLSMGFGNPYGDPYSSEILLQWADKMAASGIAIISLADTVGLAEPHQVESALKALIPAYPHINFGVHLHSAKEQSPLKIAAALDGGCRRFDGALKGIGGCPMAQNELVGNMDTEVMIRVFEQMGYQVDIDTNALQTASTMTPEVFI